MGVVDIRGFSHHQGSSTSGCATKPYLTTGYLTLPYLTTVSLSIHYQMIPLNNNHIIIHTTLPILYHPYCTIPSKNIPGYAKLPNPTILLLYHISKLPCYPLLAYHTTPLPYWWLPGTKLPIAQPLHFLLPHLSLFHPILFVPFIFS